MSTRKIPVSLCIGDFYLLGKVEIENLDIKKGDKEYKISFKIAEDDIKKIDDPDLKNTRKEALSNILQINFNTGKKKWI